MSPIVLLRAIGDEPERAFTSGPEAVRHVVTGWATRALMAEEALAAYREQDRAEVAARRWSASTCPGGVRCAVCGEIIVAPAAAVYRLRECDRYFYHGAILVGEWERGEFAHRSCVPVEETA